MSRVGIQLKPPLLQTYILPSGPSAAPLGPPGISATTSLRPSGQTRVSRRPRISTSTTEPSGMTTGPSGNSRSVAITRILAMKSSRLVLAAGGFRRSIPHAQHIVAPCYGKGDHACQATAGYPAAQGSPAVRSAAPKRLSGGPGSRFPARHCRCWNRTSRRSARSSARRRLSCQMPATSDSRSC